MTDETSAAPPSPGLFQRFMGVIFSPGPTMAAALKPPAPYAILFLCAVLTGVFTAIPQMTETGRQAVIDLNVANAERFSGQPVSDAQYATYETMARYQPILSILGSLVGTPIATLLFTALMWGIFNAVFGGTATFKEVLSVVSHGMVIAALAAIAAAPVVLMQGQMTVVGPFNLGALVPMMAEDSFLARLLGSIGVFTIWQTIVVAIGLGVLYRKKTSSIAVGLLIAYVAVTAVFVWAFSGFMGGS